MSSTGAGRQDDYWEQQRKRDEAERKRRDEQKARWKKAEPAILAAAAEAFKKLPTSPAGKLGQLLLHEVKIPYSKAAEKYIPTGRDADDLVRYLAFQLVAADIDEPYDGGKNAIASLKPFGVDAQKILDEIAPKPKSKKKQTRSKKAKKAKR